MLRKRSSTAKTLAFPITALAVRVHESVAVAVRAVNGMPLFYL